MENGFGVRVGEEKIALLLYADDIVLLASSAQELQAMMNRVAQYATKWRFNINAKKTEVMIFRCGLKHEKKGEDSSMFRLGDRHINVTSTYKYLGVDVEDSLCWKRMKQRVIDKASSSLTRAFGMAAVSDVFSAQSAIRIWESVIRPQLEYGAEVWSDCSTWREAEELQRRAAKRILRVPDHTSNEFVLSELGWWTMKSRFVYLRIRFWWHLLSLPSSRLAKRVYVASRKMYESQAPSVLAITQRKKKTLWCEITHRMLRDLRMENVWLNEAFDENWHVKLKRAVHVFNTHAWRESMCEKGGQVKSKLRLYHKIKTSVKLEPYLLGSDWAWARSHLARLRSGTSCLRVETGRHERPRLERPDRVCLLCHSGQVEDESHYLLHCSAFDRERKRMFGEIKKDAGIDLQSKLKYEVICLRMLIGDQMSVETERHVLRFINDTMRSRVRLLKEAVK
jgi:hypothetical protein